MTMSHRAGEPAAKVAHGLEDVVAFESEVAHIDGQLPELTIRGYDIAELAAGLCYEQMAHLLLFGRVPTDRELDELRQEFTRLRPLPPQVLDLITSAPQDAHPMGVLRTAVSMLGILDATAEETSGGDVIGATKGLIARLPTIVAAQARLGRGLEPLPPLGKEAGHADNYLYMVSGSRPSETMVQAFDTALVLYAEHETNASTFACRVVVGTLSDYYSAVVAGIGAIKGPLHGGAIDDAMKLLIEIGSPQAAAQYVDRALAQRRKLPGFGHRVYRAGDPRAAELKAMARAMARGLKDSTWFDIATATEERMAQTKGIIPNVDYYAAPVLYQLGFPLRLMTNVVASSRIAGWSAHIAEQYSRNRLIRPRALYVGDRGNRLDPDG